MRYGSLTNLIADGRQSKEPEVGDGVTFVYWSDRKPGTVVEVERFKTGPQAGQVKAVLVTDDKAIRTDSNGMSDAQSYRFETVWDGPRTRATLRKDGKWKTKGGTRVLIGERDAYHDYSF
jgi:hypothetical protein